MFCYSEFSWLLLLLLLFSAFSACKVNGNPGDSTQQGTCQEANQVCVVDGTCAGTDY